MAGKRKGRRGRGEGSVYVDAKGRYVRVVELPPKADGKRRRKYFRGRTKSEVLKVAEEWQQKHAVGLTVDPSKVTVAQYFEGWLKAKQPHLAPSTYKRYDIVIRLHINEHVGGVRLQALEPLMVQRMYSAIKSSRNREHAHQVLRGALNDAVQAKVVLTNACHAVIPPVHERRKVSPLGPDELDRFFQAAEVDRLCALFITAAGTGARQGEVFGLVWTNIFFEKGLIGFTQQLTELAYKTDKDGNVSVVSEVGIRDKLKTKGSTRLLRVSKHVLVALREHREKMLAEGHGSPFVFCTPNGKPIRKSNFHRRIWVPLLERAKIQDFRFHDLRHTYAAWVLSRTQSYKLLQSQLGHSRPSTTLDIYGHLLPEVAEGGVEAVDEMLARWRNQTDDNR